MSGKPLGRSQLLREFVEFQVVEMLVQTTAAHEFFVRPQRFDLALVDENELIAMPNRRDAMR